MQRRWSIAITGGILAIGAALLLAQNTSWLTGTVDQKFDTLANIQPGLGTVMIEYSTRMGNIYYAAQAGNWGMAAYQLKEMVEIQEVGETTRPGRAAALKGMEQGALKPLALDIVNQNLTAFNTDFNTAVAFCNACHAATGFDYVVYKLPAQPEVPAKLDTGQTFTAQQLQTLLAGILAP
ncbi:MAG: hypothetical protein HY236_15900 [Acidobacteria bacterium]|nr:hypothetical protein [Acidobacteriota bacterium]